tara:strand:- start:702 stop:1049 length:348 start_codon:yes stop_codon:yes gene_type:complete
MGIICDNMDTVSYDDFSKLDLRVAKITSTEKIPDKSRIIKGTISLGDEDRDVIIGGAQFYDPEDLIGKTVIVVANLEPKKMAGVESNAMLLAADIDNKPFWLTVNDNVPEGTKIK